MSICQSTSFEGHPPDVELVSTTNGVARLRLFGELDSALAPQVQTRLAGVDGDVELDCAGLTFMDSAGISLFVGLHHARVDAGAKLSIVNAPRCVTRLLALTGVDQLVEVRSEDDVT